MTKIPYTAEQIQLLQSNQYVKACTEKYITFTDNCKIQALKLDSERWYFRDIFRYFWFPEFLITSSVPKKAMWNWKHAMKTKWIGNMIGQKKGRKRKEKIDISQMSKDEYIKYLEAKTAYLEEIQKMMYWNDP